MTRLFRCAFTTTNSTHLRNYLAVSMVLPMLLVGNPPACHYYRSDWQSSILTVCSSAIAL